MPQISSRSEPSFSINSASASAWSSGPSAMTPCLMSTAAFTKSPKRSFASFCRSFLDIVSRTMRITIGLSYHQEARFNVAQYCYNETMASDLKSLKTQFLEYIEIEKGRSVKTVENYDRYLRRFLDYASAKGGSASGGKVLMPSQITEQMVREFRITLNRSSGVSGTMKKNTQNYHLIALRAFLKFLRKRDIESLNPE